MSNNIQIIQEHFFESIQKVDRHQGVLLIERFASEHGYKTAIQEIVEPVLERIGNLWLKGEVSLAVGYTAGKIAEDILNNARSNLNAMPVDKGNIVLGNIEDDFHPLGRRLVSVFLQTEGWHVVDLGNDVTADIFVDEALRHNAAIIGASAMMYSTAMNIKKVREEINRRNLEKSIKLAVGGAIFVVRPELVAEVGGDGTAKNAMEADALMCRLKKEVL